ncbi:MAG: ABC transporter permease subunit [Eubacteriales bacterium]|nr:ABC transporter permease subunit [Eubacteriales bacterium]
MKKKKKINWKRTIPFYIMMLPGIMYLMINNYIPMFGIVIAFKKLNFRKGIFGSDWCGLENFEYLFSSSDAWTITRNTIGYNLANIVLGTVFAMAMAIMLNEITSRRRSKFYQTMVLLPYLMSWVVVGYICYAFLSSESGMVNGILAKFGLEPVSWYNEKKYWPFLIIFFNLWKGIGYSMIVYFAGIVGISADYYEAAVLDGATKWQQIKNITVPLMKPTIITMLILGLGNVMRSDFGLFYQLPRNSGALYSVTRTLDVYVYNALMKNNDFGMSSAASFYQAIVGFILIITANKLVRRYSEENALF